MLTSILGIRFIALKENEDRALSLGIDPLRARLLFIIVSVIFTSIAGSIYAQYLGSISQSIFGLDIFIVFLIILGLGGIGTFYGPLVAAILWTFIDFWLSLFATQYRIIILSIATIVVLIYLRSGIGGLIDLIGTKLIGVETHSSRRKTSEEIHYRH
jgi:branched-chain amino acid transport system permease protein